MCSLWCEDQCAVDMRYLKICLSLEKVHTNVGLQIVGPILYIKATVVEFVYLCGQKLGSAWKILPITAHSLCSWSVVDGKIG
jgi:hypothetical protein